MPAATEAVAYCRGATCLGFDLEPLPSANALGRGEYMCRRCIDAVQAAMQPTPVPPPRATSRSASAPLPIGAEHDALVNRLLGPFGPDAEARYPVIATARASSDPLPDYDDLMSVGAYSAPDSTRSCPGPLCTVSYTHLTLPTIA